VLTIEGIGACSRWREHMRDAYQLILDANIPAVYDTKNHRISKRLITLCGHNPANQRNRRCTGILLARARWR
jgi:hypothetical protein